MKTHLALIIESWMTTEGLTQVTAAQRIGVSQTTVGRWIDGGVPKDDGRHKLAEALGRSTDEVAKLAVSRVRSTKGVGFIVDQLDELQALLDAAEATMSKSASRSDLTVAQRQHLVLTFGEIVEGLDHLSDFAKSLIENVQQGH